MMKFLLSVAAWQTSAACQLPQRDRQVQFCWAIQIFTYIFMNKFNSHFDDSDIIQALNLLQERHQWSLCAVAFLCVLQYSVSCQEDQVSFVFLSFFSPQ